MFIVFEGPDCVGKTTLINKLKDYLNENNYKVYFTKEPGGTKIGEEIRNILKNKDNENITNLCEQFLFMADRAQHCEEINKLLDEQYTVISDRFAESSFVYNGLMKDSATLIYHLNSIATANFVQDLTIYVMCDPEIAFERYDKKDRIESEKTLEDIKKIHFHYRCLFEEDKIENKESLMIDTSNKTIDESFEELLTMIKPYFINFKKY